MESAKIILVCIGAAILYGIAHDQITARICVEYFTIFHPPIFATRSPTLLGLGWGIIATWWVGASLGVVLAIAARAGSRRKLTSMALVKPVGALLVLMAACALLSGIIGFFLARAHVVGPPAWVAAMLTPSAHSRFVADWWAHGASYLVGFVGGMALCVMQYRKRAAQP